MGKGFCKYCGIEKELCGAHIIPKAFYHVHDHSYIGLSSEGSMDLVHSQSGLKDYNILCSECDRLLGKYDQYAANILKNKLLNYPMLPEEYSHKKIQLYLLTKNNFDYLKLRKFFISLVWRASISKICNVSLGQYENIALEILKGNIIDNPNYFHPIIIRRSPAFQFSDIAYVSMGKLCKQKDVIIVFPEYQISVITNISPIKHEKIIKMLSLNTEEFAVIETDVDINQTYPMLNSIVAAIKQKNGGFLPKFKGAKQL